MMEHRIRSWSARLLVRAVASLLALAGLITGLVAGSAVFAGESSDGVEGTDCFVSAYYRRVITQPGFVRIAVTVTLPEVTTDPVRDRMDGFHIYLGGTAMLGGTKSEVDAGLGWEITRDAYGAIDTVNRAWRPIVRTSAPADYRNAPAVADFYWYPGEVVTMTFEVISPNKILLTVKGAGKEHVFGPLQAYGFNTQGKNQNLKWVVSLDQSGRELKGPVPTLARVIGAHVRDVTVWDEQGNAYPLTPELVFKPRTCIMPDPSPFSIEYRAPYADEVISIYGMPEEVASPQ